MKIKNKIYNIKNDLNKKIVHISDLHFSDKQDLKNLNLVLNNIKKLNPDYICITGDIINKSQVDDEEYFIDWLKDLTRITKVIVSIGNHEYYIDKTKKIFGLNKKFLNRLSRINNLYLLDNKNMVIDNINFIGVTVPIEYYENVEYFYRWVNNIKANKTNYNILLFHSPMNLINYNVLQEKNINLILCGHMHGGIVFDFLRPVFKNGGLISPTKKPFPKEVYGYIKKHNINIIITSGIKILNYKLLNKLFSPEIVEINLTNK